jgi:hypothetical protein
MNSPVFFQFELGRAQAQLAKIFGPPTASRPHPKVLDGKFAKKFRNLAGGFH